MTVASKTKGGGTKKVCLPASKVRSMSAAEKKKVISAKRSAAAQGKYKRSSSSNVKGARKKGATLRDWFEKENWVQVSNGKPCGASMKKEGPSMKTKNKKNNCRAAWKEWKKSYLEKEGGRKEAARERREFYCDNGKIKLRPSDDADVPYTKKQIKQGAQMGGTGGVMAKPGLIGAFKLSKQFGVSKADPRRTIGKGKNFNKVAKDKSATGAKAGGGMTEKGVREYRRNNPGSKLKTAVTTPPSKLKPGSKAAKRRKSFCARSKGWTGERGKAARRRWNC